MTQSTGNFVPIISAAQGAMSYTADASSTDFTGALSGLTAISDQQLIQVKELTISIPKEEAEKVDLIGLETTTVGSGVVNDGQFQNQFHDIKSVSEGEINGKMILTLASQGTNGDIKDMIDLVAGSGTAVSTTHQRYSFGNCATDREKVLTGAIMVLFDTGKVAGAVIGVNPVVNFNEITATGTDGHFEIDFTAKILAKNFALEFEKI